MTTVPKAKRKTDPCPCGSGKQYRYCHGAPPDQADEAKLDVESNPRQLFLWLVIVGAPLAWLAGSFMPSGSETPQTRVWSEEHGHYHTVDGKELGNDAASATPVAPGNPNDAGAGTLEAGDGSAPAPAPVPAAQPPGPTPPGKVWSAEHGHWHDVDAGKATGAEPVIFDPSSGKPWDHDYELPRPDEERPGFTWSEAHGHWHPNE